MPRKIWIQLVDENGDNLVSTDYVDDVPDDQDIAKLRDSIKDKHGAYAGESPAGLIVYASRAVYNDRKKREAFRSSTLLAELRHLGQDEDNALIVEVSARRTKVPRTATGWTTTTRLELTASALPSLGDCQLPIWKLEAAIISGFGVRSAGKNLFLSRRGEAVKLFQFLRDDVLRDGRLGYVLGPPGSGKSSTAAAFALALARKNTWVVTWIHLCRDRTPVCVRLEGNVKKTTRLTVHYIAGGELQGILDGVDDRKKHFVILDGVTVDHNMDKLTCTEWLMLNQVNRRLVIVTSMTARGKFNEQSYKELNSKELFVSSWVLSEYLEAVKDDDLFDSVRAFLDSSDDLEPDDAESMQTWRQALVRSKIYFAGGSARYMFDRSTAEVVELLDGAVHALSNVSVAAAGTVGSRSADATNRLYRHYGRDKVAIVSRYAGSALAMFGGPGLIRILATVLQEDSNAAMNGWILEMYFLARIRKGGVTLNEGSNTIFWPEGEVIVVDPENLPELPSSGWLKPHKYNQGGYDAVYIDKKLKLLRFIQVTRAKTHTFHIGYFNSFLKSLVRSVPSFEIKTLEIFFVIERKSLDEFKFSTITGQGLLKAFPTWPPGKEDEQVRRVGIDGVASWNDFDW